MAFRLMSPFLGVLVVGLSVIGCDWSFDKVGIPGLRERVSAVDPTLEALGRRWTSSYSMEGRWSPLAASSDSDEDPEVIAALEALGYVDGYDQATEAGGVLHHNPAEAHKGLNLLISGHAQEALLLDMEGEVRHRWVADPASILPELSIPPEFARRGYFRRGWALEDGGFLGILEGIALVRLDRHSKPLWIFEGGSHHDAALQKDGSIYVLTRTPRYRLPRPKLYPYLHDTITHLSAEGEVLEVFDLHQAVKDSPLGERLRESPFPKDPLHTNTIELIDAELARSLPEVEVGQLLVSFRSISALAIFDCETERLVWVREGSFRYQHQPTSGQDGSLLLFDNQVEEVNSRVLSLRLDSSEEEVIYGGLEGQALKSPRWGSVQRLGNGNVLISESERGRAREVTPDGEVVWSYLNPHRAGANNELIATLIEMVRLPSDYGQGWLDVDE